jgi:hypothetical protein
MTAEQNRRARLKRQWAADRRAFADRWFNGDEDAAQGFLETLPYSEIPDWGSAEAVMDTVPTRVADNLFDTILWMLAPHTATRHMRWRMTSPTGGRDEHYCQEDQQAWPCATVANAMEGLGMVQ